MSLWDTARVSSWNALRLRPRPPWIGPILGGSFAAGGDRPVSIGAAADPLLGKAAACVLLPLRSDGNGGESPLWDRALVQRVAGDDHGRFRVETPASLRAAAGAVLMILLYEQFTDPWNPAGSEFGSALYDAAPQLFDRVMALDELPPRLGKDVRSGVEAFLAGPEKDRRTARIPVGESPQPDAVTFAVASCQYPAGFLDREVAESSYARLAARLKETDRRKRPEALLLLGDQIYADATAGLFDPTALHDRFDLPHERLLRTKPLQRLLRSIPAYMMLDDHEIEDNWEAGSGSRENLVQGRRSYFAYQRMAGPPPVAPDCLWYPIELNGFDFFMADTRTERQPRTAQTAQTAHIVGDEQFPALLAWLDMCKQRDLRESTDRPKFIASPASLLPRYARAGGSALRSDGWDGYPASLHRLLAHIAKNEIRKVIFLSGDAHISFDAKALVLAPGAAQPIEVRSIHSSALYAPFPFGNAVEADFPARDTLKFDGYACEVDTTFAAPGDGFAVLHVEKDGGGWDVRPEFDRVK